MERENKSNGDSGHELQNAFDEVEVHGEQEDGGKESESDVN